VRSALSATEAYVSRWLGAVDKIDHFIAVSDFLRDKVISLGLPRDKVTTVHNFMDCTGIVPADTPGTYLLYFGRLERIKGIYTLLEAVAPLRDTPVLIVGDGNEKLSLQNEITQRGLDHVKLLGFKHGQELRDLVRGSICTIAPSEWYETFGLTLVESFAHGRPVVASRIGGMTEVVADGVDGFLVQPGDVAVLRERLSWMATHRADALEMGLLGRARVEEQFSPERHYEKIMEVYRKVGAR
jgi:glycosyltransferase involved in cell wall biosynthesis